MDFGTSPQSSFPCKYRNSNWVELETFGMIRGLNWLWSRIRCCKEGKVNKDEGMTPEKKLLDRSREWRKVKLRLWDGIEPVKLLYPRFISSIRYGSAIGSFDNFPWKKLFERSKWVSCERFFTDEGNSPPNPLSSSLREVDFARFLRVDGSWPVKEFFERSRCTSSERFHSEEGTVPDKAHSQRLKTFKDLRLPIESCNLAEKLVEWRTNDFRLPLEWNSGSKHARPLFSDRSMDCMLGNWKIFCGNSPCKAQSWSERCVKKDRFDMNRGTGEERFTESRWSCFKLVMFWISRPSCSLSLRYKPNSPERSSVMRFVSHEISNGIYPET